MPKFLNTIYNFHWVLPGEAARAAQATLGGLHTLLVSEKIQAVINLRGRNPDYGWWHYETSVCEKLGVAHFDAMLDSRKLPTRAMLTSLFDAFDSARRPFLIKCSGGQDRTGFAAALYLIQRNGWQTRVEAEKQFSHWPYLHFPKAQQRWLKSFLAYGEGEARGVPLAQWVRDGYDPQHFAQWLDENGLKTAYKGVFVKPEASRWQW